MDTKTIAARAVLTLLCSIGCNGRADDLSTAAPDLAVSPAALSFSTFVGATATQPVTLGNLGQAGDEVRLTLNGPAVLSLSLAGAAAPASIAMGPGALEVAQLTFAPTLPGTFNGTLAFTGSSGTISVAITATALAALPCVPDGACDQAVFVADAGTCVHSQAPDGTACAATSTCLTNTQCAGGQCLGQPIDCDDHNACTQDSCVEGQGCQHLDTSATCAGSAPCQVYGCDPRSGCTQSQAPDGTLCSTNDTCQTAEVCILGTCEGVAVPDGTPCKLAWEPCVDAGCRGGACHDAVAEHEQPGQLRWSIVLPNASGPFAVDNDGGVSFFTGTELTDGGGAQSALHAYDACGAPLWTSAIAPFAGALLGDDQLVAWSNSNVFGLDRATGTVLWSLFSASGSSDAGECGSAPQVIDAAPALTADGLLYVPLTLSTDANCDDFPAGFNELFAVYRDGTQAWSRSLPSYPLSVVANPAGDAYVLETGPELGTPLILGFDSTGRQILTVDAGFAWEGELAVDPSGLFVQGANTWFGFDGGAGVQLPVTSGYCSGTGWVTIDAAGSMTTVSAGYGSQGGLFSYDATGSLLWQAPNPTLPFNLQFALPVLGDDGTLFVAAVPGCTEFYVPSFVASSLLAFDGQTGTQLWSTPIQSNPSLGPASHLALSPSASLLVSTVNAAQAYFAGRTGPSTTAPWSRERGSNANRGAPSP